MGSYPRLDKNVKFVIYSYETLLAEGSVDGSGQINEPTVVAMGMVGYDTEINGNVVFPGDPHDPEQKVWDVLFKDGDISTVEDIEAVISGVILKILTVRGELEYPPYGAGWGSDVYKKIYETLSPAALRSIEDAVWIALDEMDRISRVVGVQASQADKGVVVVEATVETIEGEVNYFQVNLTGG